MADALSLLREFTIANRSIQVVDDNLVFGSVSLPRSTETTYKSHRGAGAYYSLGAVWFALQHRDSEYGPYIAAARQQGVPAVSAVDRTDLLNYVTGKTASSQYIDTAAAAGADAAARRSDDKRRAREGDDESDAKKARTDAAEARGPKVKSADQLFVDEVVRRERTAHNLTNFLFTDNKSFSVVLKVLKELDHASRSAPSPSTPGKPAPGASASGVRPAAGSPATKQQPGARPSGAAAAATAPIIIVPAADTAVINLHNVKEFLEHETYTPPEAKPGTRKESSVIVTHRYGGVDQPFMIVDTPERLKESDWARVICVFAHGPSWQFKGWPGRWSDPAHVFHNAVGIHLKFRDAPLETNIKNWNVNVIEIERSRRHQDATASARVWTVIEGHLQARPRR